MYIFAVVPFVGTWIEITTKDIGKRYLEVVPFVGTWIEITTKDIGKRYLEGRTLRGYVD